MESAALLENAQELVRLAGKHSDLWTSQDYESFRSIRDQVAPEAVDIEEPLNIFGYSEAEWRIMPQETRDHYQIGQLDG